MTDLTTWLIAFSVGFISHAGVRALGDQLYSWSVERRHRRELQKGRVQMDWIVKIRGIQWDDGKGEYDVTALPKDVTVTVNADDETEAVEIGMLDVSDTYGFLIDDVKSCELIRVKRGH